MKARQFIRTIKETSDNVYTVDITRSRPGRDDQTRSTSGTMAELLDYFGYTLEVGKSYEHERGRYKINMNPRNIQQLVDALNKAASNGAANGAASTYYSVGQSQVAEGVPYKATNAHPASKDPVVAKVLKQMRPGLTGLEMNNEAFLYFAYELGKDRARGMWEQYGPAIKHFYQSGIGVNEGWESGPPEYKEPYDDADDWYDRKRQEKLDIEAEKELERTHQANLTYKLIGRGPKMEPNYDFGMSEFDNLDSALAARERIMADPNTPYPEHIGIQTIKRYLPRKDVSENSQTPLHNQEDYEAKRKALQDLQLDPNTSKDPKLSAEVIRRLAGLEQQHKDLK